jgi:hypothetical protein
MTFRYRRINWGSSDDATSAAIQEFQLFALGWKGFEALDWVCELEAQYPGMIALSRSASALFGGFLEQARQLIETADPADRPGIQNFFVGKLALEQISCRRNGAGSGACDKLGAFLQIFELYKQILESEVNL